MIKSFYFYHMRLLFLILLCCFGNVFGQGVNTVDGDGKKNGYYKVYLDDHLCPTDTKTSLIAYDIYVHGKQSFELKCSKMKREFALISNIAEDSLLSGTVEYRSSGGEVMESHVYSMGIIQELIIYNRSDNSNYYWTEEYYFNKQFESQWGSCYYLSKTNTGKIISEGYFRGGDQGWQLYENGNYDDTYVAVDGDSLVVVDIKPESPKYPYLGYNVPPYIAATVGYEGLKFSTIEAGISVNIAESYLPRKTGSMLGGQVLFRYNFPTKDSVRYTETESDSSSVLLYKYYVPDTAYWGLSFEFGKYSILSYGLGYNFNTDGSSTIHGIRPFIGTSLFNFQLLYSYNILLTKKNQIGRLVNSRLTLRYIIPIKKFNTTSKT